MKKFTLTVLTAIVFIFTLFLVLSFAPEKCLAALHDPMVGPGLEANSLGGASSYTRGTTFSAFGNPATIILAKAPQISLSFDYYEPNLDSPALINTNTLAQRQTPSATEQSDPNVSTRSVGVGLVFPLSKYFAFGLSAYLPSNTLARIFTLSGNDSYYLSFNPRTQKPEIFSALALKLPYGFSVGAGLFYSLEVAGNVQIAITQNDAEARMLVDLIPVYTPYLGVLYNYNDLSFGTLYRAEQSSKAKVDVDVNFELNLNSNLATIPFESSSQLVAFYDPATYGFGGSYHLGDWGFYAGGEHRLWSHYRAPIIGLEGKDLQTLTGSALKPEVIKLKNTTSLRAGIERELEFLLFNQSFLLTTTLGFEQHPSALPDKLQSLAIVDTAKSALGLGLNLDCKAKLLGQEHSFKFGMGGKWILLHEQKLEVIDNSSGQITQTAHVGGSIFAFIGEFGVQY
ncbi:MAG: hypothetical protein HQK50_10340 [Oligoflexia bacterium]|nr:hypothetical protein [Oligoflexia bacterium]MBF0365960.1 hypothetical protein [Oligoflexia bacterium]